jgi:hypothetical protein
MSGMLQPRERERERARFGFERDEVHASQRLACVSSVVKVGDGEGRREVRAWDGGRGVEVVV